MGCLLHLEAPHEGLEGSACCTGGAPVAEEGLNYFEVTCHRQSPSWSLPKVTLLHLTC